MEKVWVMAALFVGDNGESRVEVVGVYKNLDKAVKEMWGYHDSTKEAWMKDGVKEVDMLNMRLRWVCVLKIKNSKKQMQLGIYEENIDND